MWFHSFSFMDFLSWSFIRDLPVLCLFLCLITSFATSLKVLLMLLHMVPTSPSPSSRCLRASNLSWRLKKNFILTYGSASLSESYRGVKGYVFFFGAFSLSTLVTKRLWSEPVSALLSVLMSWRFDRHFVFTRKWLI